MDLNEDGFVDILSGSYSRMDADMAGLFQVLYGEEGGAFAPATVLNGDDGEPLIIDGEEMIDKICTRAAAVDLNGDGRLDLVAGNFRGTFHLFKGLGKGAFERASTALMTADGELMVEGAHSDPFFVDWDGDGDLDMLSGSGQGGVYLITNTGSRTSPTFAKPKTLVEPVGHAGEPTEFGDGHLKGPQGSTRVWSADVNGDGKLDLLVGDTVRLIHLAEGVDEAEAREKDAAWQERFNAHLQSPQDPEAMDAWMERYHELQEERTAYVTPESTGYVWLLLRR